MHHHVRVPYHYIFTAINLIKIFTAIINLIKTFTAINVITAACAAQLY